MIKGTTWVNSPLIHFKPSGSVSLITTLVAFDKPLFVTVIVNVTSSPTIVSLKSTTLVTSNLTSYLASTVVEFFSSVGSSLQLVEATFSNVPLDITLTTIHVEYVSSLCNVPTFHTMD